MDPILVKFLTALFIAVVISVCIWFVETIKAPEPVARFKWLAQAILAAVGIVLLLSMIM